MEVEEVKSVFRMAKSTGQFLFTAEEFYSS